MACGLRNNLRAAGRMLSRPSGLQGLSTSNAKARLRAFGPNVLVRGTTGARLKELLAPFADPMAIMLGAAAGVYLALGDKRDGIVLLIALVPVLGVDVLMEARSRRALQPIWCCFKTTSAPSSRPCAKAATYLKISRRPCAIWWRSS